MTMLSLKELCVCDNVLRVCVCGCVKELRVKMLCVCDNVVFEGVVCVCVTMLCVCVCV